MKPISNIVYQIHYLTIFSILDLQENIYTEVSKLHYMSASEAGRHVVDFFSIFYINIFLEVQDKRYT